MRLSNEHQRLLGALRNGCHLKVHRTLDGAKVYQLHCTGSDAHGETSGEASGELSGSRSAETLPAGMVEALERHGYLQSNMKFPAATLLLTERGMQAANKASPLRPIGPRSY